jgi:hypothetical protein
MVRVQQRAPRATSTAPHAQFKKHRKEAQAVRTCEIERRQTRRQCARQRLHTRSSDLVPCEQPSLTHDRPSAQCTLCPLRRPKAILRHKVRSAAQRTTHDTQRIACPGRERKRRPQVPWRLSVVRLGGSARASASTPASPIRFPAGRTHPTLDHDPSAQCTLWPPQGNPPPQGPSPAPRTTRNPHIAARPDRERQHTSPRPDIPLR